MAVFAHFLQHEKVITRLTKDAGLVRAAVVDGIVRTWRPLVFIFTGIWHKILPSINISDSHLKGDCHLGEMEAGLLHNHVILNRS